MGEFVERAHAELDRLAGVPMWSLSPAETADLLTGMGRLISRLEGLRMRVLAHADAVDVAALSAATSTGAWLAAATRTGRSAAHREVSVATALDRELTLTSETLSRGAIGLDQARVVVRAVAALPAGTSGRDRLRAEAYLVDQAEHLDAPALTVLGRHLAEVLDPEEADRRLGERLEAEERAAARAAFLTLWDNGDGSTSGRFRLPTHQAAMLRKALEAFINPRRHSPDASDAAGSTSIAPAVPDLGATPSTAPPRPSRRPRADALGAAFGELIERLPGSALPVAAGMSATVVVTMDLDQLRSGLGAASLDTGQAISASLARRMACEAGLVPAVFRRALGGASVALDLGRETRLHTKAQRLAMAVRDGGCTATGCDRPAGWCHAHHDQSWTAGGGTSVANGRLLCAYHHGVAHSPRYEATPHDNGRISFHRRT